MSINDFDECLMKIKKRQGEGDYIAQIIVDEYRWIIFS